MKGSESYVEGIVRSVGVIDLINNHLRRQGKRYDQQLVRLDVNGCHPAIALSVHYLEDLGSKGLPLPSVLSGVVSLGIHFLSCLRLVGKTEEYQGWSLSEVIEALRGTLFPGLQSPSENSVFIEFHAWIFVNCERLAESLGIEDPRAIFVLALISGLLFHRGIPLNSQEDMLAIILEFVAWVDKRVAEEKKLYRLEGGEFDSWVAQRTSRNK